MISFLAGDFVHLLNAMVFYLLVLYRHQGSFNIAHVKDSAGNDFATRLGNVFVVGKESRPWVSLPRGKGIKLNILEQRELKEKRANN